MKPKKKLKRLRNYVAAMRDDVAHIEALLSQGRISAAADEAWDLYRWMDDVLDGREAK